MNNLLAVLKSEYGVNLMQAPTYSIIWAAEKVRDSHGRNIAKRELAAANRWLDRCGKMPVYAEYGSDLF